MVYLLKSNHSSLFSTKQRQFKLFSQTINEEYLIIAEPTELESYIINIFKIRKESATLVIIEFSYLIENQNPLFP